MSTILSVHITWLRRLYKNVSHFVVFSQSYDAFDLLGLQISCIYATIPHFSLEFAFRQIKIIFFLNIVTLQIAIDARESSISCFLPASVKQAKTWKPKTPATFQQTKTSIIFSALRAFTLPGRYREHSSPSNSQISWLPLSPSLCLGPFERDGQ